MSLVDDVPSSSAGGSFLVASWSEEKDNTRLTLARIFITSLSSPSLTTVCCSWFDAVLFFAWVSQPPPHPFPWTHAMLSGLPPVFFLCSLVSFSLYKLPYSFTKGRLLLIVQCKPRMIQCWILNPASSSPYTVRERGVMPLLILVVVLTHHA